MVTIPLYALLFLFLIFLVIFTVFSIINVYHIIMSASVGVVSICFTACIFTLAILTVITMFFLLSGVDFTVPLIEIKASAFHPEIF